MKREIKFRGKQLDMSNDEQQLVPIKPICDALGVDYSSQLQTIKNDEFLASTMGLCPIVAADGKNREILQPSPSARAFC